MHKISFLSQGSRELLLGSPRAGTHIFLGNLVSVSPSRTLKFSFFPRTIATLNGLTTTETVTAETGDGFKS